MVHEIQIQNFKLFKDLKHEDLGRVNLIVGENNIGKTALLEALYLERAHDLGSALVQIMQERKESGIPFVLDYVKRWFHNPSQLDIDIGDSKLEITDIYGGNSLARRMPGSSSRISLDQSLPELTSRLDPAAKRIAGCLAIWQTGLDAGLREKYWDDLVLRGEHEHIVKVLQLLDPSIKRIGLKDDGHTVKQPYYLDNQDREYPLGRLGLGMSRLLGLAFGLYFCKQGRLIVDEIETGLHFDAQEKVWRWIFDTAARLDVQLFATTHSLDCVRAFAEVSTGHPEEGRLYRLDCKYGVLRAVKFDEEQLRVVHKQAVEVR